MVVFYSKVLGYNAKIDCSLYKIEAYAVTNWSTRLEKHTTIENFHGVDFLRIFKNIAFLKKKSRF